MRNVRYIQLQNVGLKKIYAIRGNHEDLVLRTLHFIEIFTLLSKDKQESFSACMVDEKTSLTLNQLEPCWREIISKEGETLLKLALNFTYRLAAKNEGYAKEHFSNFEKRIDDCINCRVGNHWISIKNLFIYAINAIKNGAGWVFNLTSEQRLEVKDFIISLPYIIRVNAVMQGDQVITAAFDIVHAAPLSEDEIQKILAIDNSVLNSEQIHYVTWARPKSLCRKDDPEMNLSHRSAGSIRTYVGHNVLSAHLEEYRDKNILDLDADTYGNKGMFIVNHTQAILSVEPCNLRISDSLCYNDVFPALWALRDLLRPSEVTVEQKHSDIYGYALVVCRQKILVQDVLKMQQPLVLPNEIANDGEIFRCFKTAFSVALKFIVQTLPPALCVDLSRFLLQQSQHPLARELSYFNKKLYSYQTKSMSAATGLLLQQGARDSNSDSKVAVKKQCFSTKVVFFVPSQGEGKGMPSQKVYSFSGYRKIF